MKVLRDTRHMTVRHLLALWRQPWWIAVTLVQPIIWLLLFGCIGSARLKRIRGWYGRLYR